MTDEAPKKAWARCPACSTVYPNIQIAKDGHKLNCPYDMQLRMKTQDEKIAGLDEKILALGGNLDEISADPGIDFTGVEDDEEQEPSVADLAATDEQGRPTYVPAPVGPEVDDEWDDDEESLGSTPIVR